jgi:xylulokinase
MRLSYLVFDYGTTALKVVGYDDSFCVLATAVREWSYLYPGGNRIELPVADYWHQTVSGAQEVIEKAGGVRRLRAISITGQSETLIALANDGQPLGRAMVWHDTRPQAEFDVMSGIISQDMLYARTGNTALDPVMPLLKLPWMKANEPDRYFSASKFLLLRDYIFYKLTGELTSEYTTSCCTGYFNIVQCRWDDELLAAAGIDQQKLPELTDSRHVAASLSEEARVALDVPAGVSVVSGLLDQCASALGAGNTSPGMISETTGTVLAVAATLSDFKPETMREKVLMFRHAVPGKFMALPNCPTAGVLLSWFRNRIVHGQDGTKESYASIDKQVEKRRHHKELPLLLPHFCGRLSPVNCAKAKGVLYGLTLDTDRYDIAFAIMESVAHLLRENLELLSRVGITSQEVIALGGAAKSRVWLQIKADTCNRSMVTLSDPEATARGCAFNAALALGDLIDDRDASLAVERGDIVQPIPSNRAHGNDRYGMYQRLNQRLGFDHDMEVII